MFDWVLDNGSSRFFTSTLHVYPLRRMTLLILIALDTVLLGKDPQKCRLVNTCSVIHIILLLPGPYLYFIGDQPMMPRGFFLHYYYSNGLGKLSMIE